MKIKTTEKLPTYTICYQHIKMKLLTILHWLLTLADKIGLFPFSNLSYMEE